MIFVNDILSHTCGSPLIY